MTNELVHRNFNIEADKSNLITSSPSFLPEEIDYFVNTEIERFIKTRYSGLNIHKDGFQQSQKRSDDLRTVTKSVDIIPTISMISKSDDLKSSKYTFEYPIDYFIGLGETAYISTPNALPSGVHRVDVMESTIENIDSSLQNSLSPYRYHNGTARPLRVYSDGKINLYTDENYIINKYTITYLFLPAKLDWYSGDRNVELTIMPDHTWDEIIVNAVKLALLNTSDDRYQAYSQEAQIIE